MHGKPLFDLERFLKAQDPMFDTVLAELRHGRKQSHWMWFVFPQLRELAQTPTARRYGIVSLSEAADYLQHRLLGPRLTACVEIILALHGRSLNEIFGSPDDVKFRSSMTLFMLVSGNESVFQKALHRYCDGVMDQMTLDLLRSPHTSS